MVTNSGEPSDTTEPPVHRMSDRTVGLLVILASVATLIALIYLFSE
jgi:hypothetical protein